MRADAVRLALEQRRSAARASAIHGFLHGAVHRDSVVAVDLHAGEPVRDGFDRDALRRRLIRGRDADRPVVVLADEHDGRLEHAREVQCDMEVGGGSRAIAHVRRDDGAVSAQLRRHSRPHGLRQLRSDTARPAHLVHAARSHVAGHLPPFGLIARVAEHLGEVRHQRETTQQHRARFTQRGEDPVGRLERDGRG